MEEKEIFLYIIIRIYNSNKQERGGLNCCSNTWFSEAILIKMFYPTKLIKKICARNGIVKVVSEYVHLEQRDNLYYGICPFHKESTPSLIVDKRTQSFYCFGCGAGGNVVNFIMKMEGCSFEDALQILANKVGIDLPEVNLSKESELKKDIFEMNVQTARYYYRKLRCCDNAGIRYLRNRGLTDETMKKFGLGLSDKFGKEVYLMLKSKGFSDATILTSGLVSFGEIREKEKGEDFFDKFWNRVIFPIMDENDRIIGFGGRVLGEGRAKYINSPETLVFDKGCNLYGLNHAKHTSRPYMILCEGYMDVIALHQAGFDNAVASLGTALTAQQAKLLAKYTNSVYLSYDSDDAGINAAMKAIPILANEGIEVKVINMEPHKDPDEFIKNLGKEAFEKRIAEAENSDRFEVRTHKRRCSSESEFYSKVADILLKRL